MSETRLPPHFPMFLPVASPKMAIQGYSFFWGWNMVRFFHFKFDALPQRLVRPRSSLYSSLHICSRKPPHKLQTPVALQSRMFGGGRLRWDLRHSSHAWKSPWRRRLKLEGSENLCPPPRMCSFLLWTYFLLHKIENMSSRRPTLSILFKTINPC